MSRLRRFLSALFSVLEFFHLLHRRLLIELASAVFFHDPVSIAEALELFEGALDGETISDINADFVSGVFFIVGQWNLSKSWCFRLFGKIAQHLKKASFLSLGINSEGREEGIMVGGEDVFLLHAFRNRECQAINCLITGEEASGGFN